MHYNYTTAPLNSYADVEPRLKAIPALATYEKGRQGLFAITHGLLSTALQNADRANRAATLTDTDNPTTEVPVLIRYLQDLFAKKVR